jgi:hypothetical protein
MSPFFLFLYGASKFETGCIHFTGQIKNSGDMYLWNNETMTARDWESILYRKGMKVFRQ